MRSSLPSFGRCYKLRPEIACSGNRSAVDTRGVGATLNAFRLAQTARRLRLAPVDTREDDPVAGMKAREAGRIEHPDLSQAATPRLLGPGERLVAAFDLRDRDEDVGPPALPRPVGQRARRRRRDAGE